MSGLKESVWYWPEKNQLLRAIHLNRRHLLMFFSDYRYYFHPITRGYARAVGMVKVGE